jgi:hypothetical protein
MSQRYIGGLIYNPPGGFSGAFDGASDYLTVPNNSAFNIGSGDFTVEGFVNFNSVSGTQALVSQFNSGGTGPGWTLYKKTTSNVLEFYGGSGTITVTGTIPLVVGVWTHFAVVRSGSTITIYVNGVAGGSGTNSSFTDETTTGLYIGSRADSIASLSVNGFLSNIRIVKGTAVYTSAFTPPVGQLQAITNTSLLTCAYSTFRDGSTNNFTITVNGNTAVSTQNPFPLTTLPNPALGNQGNGVYSMSQYQSLLSQNLWPAVDPYWEYVTLMLHGNGTNGAQNNTFLDSSTNNFTITRNGNTTQGTFSPYGNNWSNYFDGTGDYLTVADSATLEPGSSDFTFECWVFPTATGSYLGVFSKRATNGVYGPIQVLINNGTMEMAASTSGSSWAVVATASSSPALNTWSHIAVVRNGTASNNLVLYLNGVSVATGSVSSTALFDNSGAWAIGADAAAGTGAFAGYISNFRYVKGSAVYTAAFTPPTSPLTAITNTSLLTCQSNRFIDNSTNAFTITRNGDVSVQRFSPFNPTAPYAAGTDGGSGYFDGTGDYLTAPANAAFNFGTGAFTIEAWVYLSTVANNASLILNSSYNGNNGDWIIRVGAGGLAGKWEFTTWFGGTPYTASSNNNAVAGTWTHIAGVRNGNTFTLYINGVAQTTTATNTNSVGSSSLSTLICGDNTSGVLLTGYVNDLRVVKGTAVYTSNFTPPTAPLTAITNTSLLLNYTNAGIIDNAEMNNLETVGNAQISTAQSKFGGASMLFDGSGDRLYGPSNQNFNFGTGDFTIEFWVNPISQGGHGSSNNDCLIDFRPGSNGVYGTLYIFSNGTGVYWYVNSANRITGGAISNSVWTHIALCRASGSTRLFLNGTQSGSTYTDSNNYLVSPIMIGEFNDGTGGGNFNGYIDDLRITKFVRYTSTFTPQRSQWQDQ